MDRITVLMMFSAVVKCQYSWQPLQFFILSFFQVSARQHKTKMRIGMGMHDLKGVVVTISGIADSQSPEGDGSLYIAQVKSCVQYGHMNLGHNKHATHITT